MEENVVVALTKEEKQSVLKRKIQAYRADYYSHQVDAKVAQDIGGLESVVEQARRNMANAQKFIDALEELLAEL